MLITKHLDVPSIKWRCFFWRCPPVICYSLLLKMVIYSGFTHWTWWFSIVIMLVSFGGIWRCCQIHLVVFFLLFRWWWGCWWVKTNGTVGRCGSINIIYHCLTNSRNQIWLAGKYGDDCPILSRQNLRLYIISGLYAWPHIWLTGWTCRYSHG